MNASFGITPGDGDVIGIGLRYLQMELRGIQIVILVERSAVAPFNGDPQGPLVHLQRPAVRLVKLVKRREDSTHVI